MRALLTSALIVMPLQALPAGAQPRGCPTMRAIYESTHTDAKVRYRLSRSFLPRDAVGSAVSEWWTVEATDRRTGRRLSRLRFVHGCSNGRGPCSISIASEGAPDGRGYSEVVELNRDFTPARGDDAPYAIVTPGLGQTDWSTLSLGLRPPELRYYSAARRAPDLGLAEAWVRVRCAARR